MKKLAEVAIVTVLLVGFARFLFGVQDVAIIGKFYATIFAVTFVYVPALVLWKTGRRVDFIDSSLAQFSRGVAYYAVSALIVLPPFLILSHYWMKIVFGYTGFEVTMFPELGRTIVFQLLFIAFPEEFFFRGYMQPTLESLFKKKWRIFGVELGWGWIITCVIFAISHSFVRYQWWHFSIFFPALLFGWLRAKTGSITAPVLFHATSNILSDWILRSYF